MKKLLAILIGTVLVASTALAIVGTVKAQIVVDGQTTEEPEVCCKLNHTIKVGETEHAAGECPTQPGATCGISGCTGTPSDAGWGGFCLMDTLITITDWIMWFVLIIAVVAIIISGVMFITAGGSPERMGTGKKMLLYSVIGIAIALLAHLIPSLVKFFI